MPNREPTTQHPAQPTSSRRSRAVGPRGGLLLLLLTTALLPGASGAQARRARALVDIPGRPIRTVDARGRIVERRPQAAADRLVLHMPRGVSRAEAEAAAGKLGGRLRAFVSRYGLATVQFPQAIDVIAATGDAAAIAGAASASLDTLVYLYGTPSDDRYDDQWHHPVIRSPEGWDVTTGSSTSLIAVIDSGVDLDHPDLASKIFVNPGEIPNNGQDDDNNGYIDDVNGWDFHDDDNDPMPQPNGIDEDWREGYEWLPDDQVRHGTLVSGLAAAAANGTGTVGVDQNARILPLQVFPDDGGAYVSDVFEAMAYAVDIGADVINLSLGGGWDPVWTTPIVDAYAAGVVVVVASGNDGVEFTASQSTWYSPVCNDGPNPATDNYVLGVGATGTTDRRPSFSNFDSSGYNFVDVSAPGQSVFGPGFQQLGVLDQKTGQPLFDDYYARGNGTSFSAPIVAGLVCLVKAHEPGLSNAQIMERIRNSADNIDAANPGFIGKLGAGRINVARALGVDLEPQPVTNLRAEDTAGDDGGSITLRWFLSGDDGGGAGDVEKYVVKRATDEVGPFSVRAELEAGTDTHDDTPAEDGKDYYYVVVTEDEAGQTTDSDVVGPASSSDDAGPPAVSGVAAGDEPGDTGGAIRVTWDSYTPPADFAAFRIYRGGTNFLTVDGRTPLATVTNASAASYLDETTIDGVDYWYAVTAADEVPNEVVDVAAYGPVQSFPNESVNFAAGVHFLATPIIPADPDPAAFFGADPSSFEYARWVPNGGADSGYYRTYAQNPSDPILALGLGRGFWCKLPEEVSLAPEGDIAPSGPFAIDLEPGWWQLGNPFLSQLDFSRTTVEYEGVTMDLASADAAGLLRRYAWTYATGSSDYQLVDTVLSTGQFIAPWRGFWVLAEKACRVVFDRTISPASSGVTEAVASLGVDWHVQLTARAGDSVDTSNYLGVAAKPDGANVQAPPRIADGVRLDFRPNGWSGEAYAASFAKPSAGQQEWRFTVTSSAAGRVVLSTPDLSALPSDQRLLLKDLAANRTVDLRTTSSYTYAAAEAGVQRQFSIEVQPRGAGLMVSSLSATPARDGGAEVRFVLTSSASCDVEVMNLAGRPVRRVGTGRVYEAGQQVISWNGRNDNGLTVPSGRYLVRVRARSTDGQTAQGLSALSVTR